jgi:ATP-dependent helicase/nuclease subunit A
MDSVQRLDAFGRIRLEQFLAAAGELDVRGATSCDLFLTHITHYEIHDVAANDALRVMTVHQAKGLGFDIVILPELDRDNMLRARDARFILSRDTETQRPRWALELPRRAVAECDAVLLDELEQADADAAFESLCLLYVAMTRARRGLYLITSYPGKTSQLLNQPAFVKERLHGNTRAIERDGHPVRLAGEDSTCLYACGAERWFETEPVVPLATIPEVPSGAVVWPPEGTSIRTRLVAIRPSDSDALDASAAELFASDRKDRLDTGSAVHSLLERVTWSEEADVEAILVAWRGESEFDAATADRAAAHFRRAMSSHMMHSHLGRAHGQTALWRERHFDVVIDSRWITGSFDRVVIEQDERGSPLGATVYDFKTDDIAAADVRSRAVLYSRQMLLYRDALAHILHISPSRIRQVLLFTAPGVAFEFPLSRESVRRD